MATESFLSILRNATDTLQQVAQDFLDEFTAEEKEQESLQEQDRPVETYRPKFGDVVSVVPSGEAEPVEGRITYVNYERPYVTILLPGHKYTRKPWNEIDLIDSIGYSPTKDYTPVLGDEVRALDDDGLVVTGKVTAIHGPYGQVEVSVTEQRPHPLKPRKIKILDDRVELIKAGPQPPKEPLVSSRSEQAVSEGPVDQVSDDTSATEDEAPAPSAYEDLKAYYEARLERAQADAQKVSQQYQDFKQNVATILGLDKEAPQRDIWHRLNMIKNNYYSYVRDAAKRLEAALEVWEHK